MPLEKILLIAKSAVHSIKILHSQRIVHGDLKPDNLPIKEAKKGYIVKLIDFDDSYFECHPPVERESLVGTPEYYSPEQAAYIMDEDEELEGNTLTCKSDIFTLGIIFCEYFSGEKPILSGGHTSTWACINDGKTFSFKKELHPQIDGLIRRMLSFEPTDRPSIADVFETLKDIKPGETTLRTSDTTEKKRLRFGPGFRPTCSKGTISTPKPSIFDTPEYSHIAPKTSEPKTASGLRGSGLKIADK